MVEKLGGRITKVLAALGLAAALPGDANARQTHERPALRGGIVSSPDAPRNPLSDEEILRNSALRKQHEAEERAERDFGRGQEERAQEVLQKFRRNLAEHEEHINRVAALEKSDPTYWKMLAEEDFMHLELSDLNRIQHARSHLADLTQLLEETGDIEHSSRNTWTVKRMAEVNESFDFFKTLVMNSQVALDASYAPIVIHRRGTGN